MPGTVWGVAPIPGLAVESKRRARLPILAASYRVPFRYVSPSGTRLACKSACLRVLACQTVAPRHAAHACGAADARLTDCARKGLRRAGRDAGTGAFNRTQELLPKKKKAGRNLQELRPCHQIYALSDRRLHDAIRYRECGGALSFCGIAPSQPDDSSKQDSCV